MLSIILALANLATLLQPSMWMKDQVEEELKPFAKGIKRVQVEKSFHRIQKTFNGDAFPIILVQIQGDVVSWNGPPNLAQHYKHKAENFCQVIKTLPPLPNLSFLACLAQDCEHPIYLRELSAPLLAAAKSERNHKALMFPKALLTPDRFKLYESVAEANERNLWSGRNSLVLWRPKTLENEYLYNDWEWDPSIRFLLMGKRHTDIFDFKLTKDAQFKKIPWWAQNYFLKADLAAPAMTPQEHTHYKYLLVCDQMHNPQDLDWQLFSGAILFKGLSKLKEWYHCQLKPNEHYISIPVKTYAIG